VLPAGHAVHSTAPAWEKVLLGQAVQLGAAAGEKLPAAQAWQAAALLAPTWVE
jgi:hypothetical protein